MATSSTSPTVEFVDVEGVESKTHADGCSCSEFSPVEQTVSRDSVGGGQAEEQEDWKIPHGGTLGGWVDRSRIDRERQRVCNVWMRLSDLLRRNAN